MPHGLVNKREGIRYGTMLYVLCIMAKERPTSRPYIALVTEKAIFKSNRFIY